MPLLALAIALLLAGPVYGGACSGTAPSDLCEAGRPALTSSGVTSSGKVLDRSGMTGRSKLWRSHKVHSALSAVASAIEVRRSTESTPAALGKLSTKLVRVNDAGEIHVYVVLTEWRPEHVAELEALGLRVEATVPARRLIQGWVPSRALDDVAALDAVKEVKPPAYGMREGAGAVNTPGDAILGAAAARSAFGVSGVGVKVGVISDGVDHLADSVMSNDLPGGVQVLAPGSGDEGTAMLEIVHDLAPGAALAFYGPSTSVDMANGINALAAAGARVVVDDLSFFFEPKFEDGLIAETVRSFATGGRVYVSAAGNQAQAHYRAVYSPVAGQNFPDSDYPAVHNYFPGNTDIGNTLAVPPFCSLTVILQWNNRFGAASDDFDLFIARSSDFAILAASGEFQTGTQDPLEATSFTNTTASPVIVFIAVSEFHLVSPPASLILDYFTLLDCSSNPGLQYVTPSDSLSGNHALVEALPIAAVNAATPTLAEAYSSQGPGTISFPFPEARAVPVLTSVDCVPTQTGVLGFFALPFCGTSAAAPHVAGLAALLIERAPTLSTEQLRGVLTATAVDLGPPGFDFTYGFGRADAFQALSFVTSAPHVQLALAFNRHNVAPGDLLQITLVEGNTGTAASQDFYFGVLVPPALSPGLGCPAGDGLVFFADNFARTVVLCYLTASPQSFAPLFAGMAIPALLPPTAVANFAVTWPAGIPAGTFTFVTFTTPPGAFADGNLGPADLTALVLDAVQASP
jgi:subtilisin family serine protease